MLHSFYLKSLHFTISVWFIRKSADVTKPLILSQYFGRKKIREVAVTSTKLINNFAWPPDKWSRAECDLQAASCNHAGLLK
jgi:hypothetical protein